MKKLDALSLLRPSFWPPPSPPCLAKSTLPQAR